ncbi:hypothetical protein MPDQ_005142 [Monascus purpureus]|uniref:ML-like domain-containing protein n=1 Tax=Monascus purpureus TaxID=5098 RepID=A0A507QWS6_MONPU|nr:hypothetical protein MPDQ_005142 [Monascus purpureus]
MRLFPLFVWAFLVLFSPASATRLIRSNSLNLCQQSTNFTATYFSAIFTPNNRSLLFNFDAVSQITGYVTADLTLTVYGYEAYKKSLNPCEYTDMSGLCPMNAGKLELTNSPIDVPADVIDDIPGIAYTVPDLDAKIRVVIKKNDTNEPITCVEANLSNGKTVYQPGVSWATAVIAGLGMAASAITSGLGYSNTAAHVASGALSLFSFMQTQAIFGMTSVAMPPIVEAWTQNFQWSMGIIRIGFLQTICTWYQRSTGGTASTLLSELSTTSVEVLKHKKRSLASAAESISGTLVKRLADEGKATSGNAVVRGIARVGFKAGIEETNIFMTGLIFFVVFVCGVMLLVAGFKGICELLAKAGKMQTDKFQEFRNGWKVVMRGILFRLSLVAFPQMTVLGLWELTRRDSPAEVLLAIVMFLSVFVSLCWAAVKVILLARRSMAMHKNPAYILYSDPACLNKWGFLYVQYRATAYYFLLPVLAYILIKGMFVALSQPAPVVQTIAFVVIETAMLIAVCVLRPWMDKKTNAYNIAIAVVNFVNAILLLFFSNVFHQPGIVTGVMGVVFFVYNAVLSLILIILVLVASVYAVVSKNPDTRYQPMRDDRSSFMKSQGQFTTELDALGATARGEEKTTYKSNLFDEDSSSFSSGNGATLGRGHHSTSPVASHHQPVSPVDTSVPLFPSDSAPRRSPSPYNNNAAYPTDYRQRSPVSRVDNSPSPWGGSTVTSQVPPYRAQNNTSPWQRGAGYEH